jgi:hypothetical protein
MSVITSETCLNKPLPSNGFTCHNIQTQTDGRDLWSAPLRWSQVLWYTYQVSERLVEAFQSEHTDAQTARWSYNVTFILSKQEKKKANNNCETFGQDSNLDFGRNNKHYSARIGQSLGKCTFLRWFVNCIGYIASNWLITVNIGFGSMWR